jgi:arylsulfatase A-like enzyme
VHADPLRDLDRPPVGAIRNVQGAISGRRRGWPVPLLSDAGYATSLWGKWHLGEIEGRLPTDQGFDEWWGYKNSVDEAGYTSYAAFRELAGTLGIESPKSGRARRARRPRRCANWT